jgi:hypothetical protein
MSKRYKCSPWYNPSPTKNHTGVTRKAIYRVGNLKQCNMKQTMTLLLALCLSFLLGRAQTVLPVSTGLNAALSGPEPVGNIDPHWQIASSPNPPGTPARVSNAYLPYWQPTPIAGTDASWINVPGAYWGYNTPGIYTFERPFNIPVNTGSFVCNFGVTYDDALVSLELVRPDASTIPLTVVPTIGYYLSQPITNMVNLPMPGTWKIRATINFIDQTAAYMLSGNITSYPCRNSFVIGLNNMGGTAPGMFSDGTGGLFATGLSGNETVIVKSDGSGNILWIQQFKLGSGSYQIRDLQVDPSGDLLGIAHQKGSVYESKIFRCDATATNFAWIVDVSDVAYTQLHLLNANEFIVTGSNSNGNTQLELRDKSNGAISGYGFEGEGGDYYSTLVGNTLYGACRRYYNGSGDFRTCVFAHDAPSGNFQWQENVISQGDLNGGPKTRMYPVAPIEDNGELVTLASGDLVGFNTYINGPVEIAAAKTDLNGNSIWTIEYAIAGYNRPVVTAIKNTANGYFIVANLYSTSLSNFGHAVVIRTDKNGTVLWARRLGLSGRNMANTVVERNGYLYLSMSSDSYQPNQLLLVKLDPQGNSSASCDFIRAISVTASGLLNVQDNRPYPVSPTQFLETNSVTAPIAITPMPRTYCETSCKDRVFVGVDVTVVDDMHGKKAMMGGGTVKALTLYPNPATDMATLQLPMAALPNTVVQLSDLSGRLLKQVPWPAGTRQLNLRLFGLLSGSYQATVSVNGQRYATAKLIKQ